MAPAGDRFRPAQGPTKPQQVLAEFSPDLTGMK